MKLGIPVTWDWSLREIREFQKVCPVPFHVSGGNVDSSRDTALEMGLKCVEGENLMVFLELRRDA